MTANAKCTSFDDKQMAYINEVAYLVADKAMKNKFLCGVQSPKTLTDISRIMDNRALKEEGRPQNQPLDVIRINTNRNVSGNIRSFFSNKESPQNRRDDWDPMVSLVGLLSDYTADKDVLETLDGLRDRFKQ